MICIKQLNTCNKERCLCTAEHLNGTKKWNKTKKNIGNVQGTSGNEVPIQDYTSGYPYEDPGSQRTSLRIHHSWITFKALGIIWEFLSMIDTSPDSLKRCLQNPFALSRHHCRTLDWNIWAKKLKWIALFVISSKHFSSTLPLSQYSVTFALRSSAAPFYSSSAGIL